MAMALSSTIAPAVALGGQRRRRATASPTNASASATASESTTRWRRATGATGWNDPEEEEKSATEPARFVRFDAALQHSDQTITGAATLFPWRRRSGADAPTRSSFFPDSTDDEATGGVAAMRASLRRDPASATPTFPVIHIGDVQFPTTRTVLWDRRVLAGPFDLSTAHVLPRVRLTNGLLKQLHAVAAEKTHSLSRLLGYATMTDLASEPLRDSDGGCVVLSSLVQHKPEGGRARGWWVPIYRGKPTHREDEVADLENMERTVRAKYESTSGTSSSRSGATTTLPVEIRGFVSTSADRSQAEMDVEIDVVVPTMHVQFRLVRSLPLLMTPLAVSLLRCEFGCEVLRFGYLTLDRARKAVPLLETDPLVLQRPVVGLWVYGIDVNDSAAPESIHVRHPYLYESCARFLSSKIIKERAQVDADTFLVAVYPGNVNGPLPRFFECTVSRPAQSSSVVGWTAASALGRCLAGVSSFKNDLELKPVLTVGAMEQSETPVESRTAPQQTSRGDTGGATSEHERGSFRRIANGSTAQHQVERVESSEFESMKSCCRSQQILASQHQKMLENQQRQLRELQDQIAQLQRVLTDTRAENARLLAASSSRSSQSSHAGAESDQEIEIPSAKVDDGVETHSSPTHPTPEEDGKLSPSEHHNNLAHDVSMVSSLALSSISAESNASELSSISSSLVGSRLKSLVTTQSPHETEPSQRPQGSASEEGTKHAGSPREPQIVCETPSQVQSEPHAENDEDGEVPEDVDEAVAVRDDDPLVRRSCPYVPSVRRNTRQRVPCEREEFEEESDTSKIDELLVERLRIPNTPNREEIVRGGSLTTIGFSHGSSFSIPKIKYVAEIVTCDSDEDEEEEIRRIELKYRSRRAH